jgi:aminoglycoside phosphotransferase (APT) family kinase protein
MAGGPVDPSEIPEPAAPHSVRRALSIACERAGLDPSGARLIRAGTNAVYRLRQPIIARVAQEEVTTAAAERQVAVARWLESKNYPAVRALHVDQPVQAGGHVVTFWESASEGEEYAPIGQVAELIRRLHGLPAPRSLVLPELRPFDEAEERLKRLVGVRRDDVDFLAVRIDELRSQYDRLDFPLAPGPIHGDANVGNVILDRNCNPILIDLDNFSRGPREWDLVQTALFYDRFGWHTEAEYRRFVDVYGFDLMRWPGYRVLADMREILMTLWLGRKAGVDEQAGSETRKRIEAIRTGGSRRDWAPF